MKITPRTYVINGINTPIIATIYEDGDKELLNKLYFKWLELNKEIKSISTRGINLPEAISENAFCLFDSNCIRVVKLVYGKSSYDVLNTKTGKRIQIKASSIDEDLSSFGPRSEWDDLYFLDFSKCDGTFNIYKIEQDWIYKHNVNSRQTFEEVQRTGKRPRFSIKNSIIIPKKLKPIAENVLIGS